MAKARASQAQRTSHPEASASFNGFFRNRCARAQNA